MNQSVWYEQIDGALIEFISNKIKLNGVPAHVFVRKPEEEFVETTFPCITIYNTLTNVHQSREDFQESRVVSVDVDTAISLNVKEPVMYEHSYQIDFWSRYQSQMNEMTYLWFFNVEKDTVVEAKSIYGSSASFYMLEKSGMRKSDLISGKERLFHSFITYSIFSDIDEETLVETPVIKAVLVNPIIPDILEVEDEDNP